MGHFVCADAEHHVDFSGVFEVADEPGILPPGKDCGLGARPKMDVVGYLGNSDESIWEGTEILGAVI